MTSHKLKFCLLLLALTAVTAQVCTSVHEGIHADVETVGEGIGMTSVAFTKVLVDGDEKSVYFMGRYKDTGDSSKRTIFVKTDEELVVTLVKVVEVEPNIYSFAADPLLGVFYFQKFNGEVFYEVSSSDFSVKNVMRVETANFN